MHNPLLSGSAKFLNKKSNSKIIMKIKIHHILFIGLVLSPCFVSAKGNTTIQSFSQAKKLLQTEVYIRESDRRTLYCGAKFDSRKYITLPDGYSTTKYRNRLARWEAEHVVPAENFGRTFTEWREGHPDCIDRKGKSFKGRRCAEKTNNEYRFMQADVFNLFPAVGATNALRQNYNFTMLPYATSSFGSCDMRIENRKVQPPVRARGQIARTYLYFEWAYSRYNMSKSQRQLMTAWDKQYPVTEFECRRAATIERIQGNSNPVLHTRCKQSKFDYF